MPCSALFFSFYFLIDRECRTDTPRTYTRTSTDRRMHIVRFNSETNCETRFYFSPRRWRPLSHRAFFASFPLFTFFSVSYRVRCACGFDFGALACTTSRGVPPKRGYWRQFRQMAVRGCLKFAPEDVKDRYVLFDFVLF